MKNNNYKVDSQAGDWMTSFKASGAMIITMIKSVSIYVQNGIARIYKGGDLCTETEVGYMNTTEFNTWLHNVENSFK